jgi:RND family efflux transporter MFP subunit
MFYSYTKNIFLLLFLSFLIPSYTLAKENLQDYEFDCVINPSRVADIGSSAVGVITHIMVDRNDFVKRGDVVATLNYKVEKAKVDVAKKRASMVSKIELADINLALAKREQNRVQKAFNRGSVSAHDLDIADTELLLAKIKQLQAKEEQLLAKKELGYAKSVLSQRTIYVPFTGVITERLKEMGEHVDAEAIVILAKIDPLYVEVILPISKLGTIKKGMKAKIYSPVIKNSSWTATVVHVDKVMDAASGTFGVRLNLPNHDHKIPAGLRCKIRFTQAVK